jgi:hypothetical protein
VLLFVAGASRSAGDGLCCFLSVLPVENFGRMVKPSARNSYLPNDGGERRSQQGFTVVRSSP